MSTEHDTRWISAEDTIQVKTLRDFVLQALHHDAIRDELIERMAVWAENGRLDVDYLAAFLPGLIDDVLGVTVKEDWMAIAALLIEDMRESLLEGAEQ
jgi:hypothetical protein